MFEDYPVALIVGGVGAVAWVFTMIAGTVLADVRSWTTKRIMLWGSSILVVQAAVSIAYLLGRFGF